MSEHCRNCGQALQGHFCAQCGQEAHAATGEPTLSHFLHDLTHETLHVDGKIFRSLRALFLEPGRLTREYWDGHIVAWVRPLRLFLIAAAIHLLLASQTVGPFNFRAHGYRNAQGDRAMYYTQTTKAKPRAGYAPLSPAEIQQHTRVFQTRYNSIRYSSVLVFAGLSWLLLRRRQPYFIQHLVLALHFYTFVYAIGAPGSFHEWLAVAGIPLTAIYQLLMLRRLFRFSWPQALGRTVLLFPGLLLIESLLMIATSRLVEG
jgi:hypothetical protein